MSQGIRGFKKIGKALILFLLFSLVVMPTVSAARGEIPVAREKGRGDIKANMLSERQAYGKIVQEMQKKYDFMGDYKATAYSPSAGGINIQDPNRPLLTATGNNVVEGRTIAVDDATIPYGSVVAIKVKGMSQYNGLYLAEDTGGAIVFNRIDMMIEPYTAAIAFGRRDIDLQVLEYGTGRADAREKGANWATYIEKYKDEISTSGEYGGNNGSGSTVEDSTDIENDKEKNPEGYTKEDYFMYRDKVENPSTGVRTGDIPIGSEATTMFYQFSESMYKKLMVVGWILSAFLIVYVSVYLMAYMTVARGSHYTKYFTEKMIEEGQEVAAKGMKGSMQALKRAVISLSLMMLFATGMYIPIMALVMELFMKIFEMIL